MFHPLVRAWFERRFAAASPVQLGAFPAIASGADTLITAPTGSGKTLAAFLCCLDRLVVEACEGRLEERTQVVYVSPLKALSNDIHKNLEQPLAEMAALAPELGLPPPSGPGQGPGSIRAAVRTGDTPMAERARAIKHPPHVLVTTPESLYILLTSASGRRSLEKVRTIILDEIHAVAHDKRGAHLAISVERLEDLVVRAGGARPQRIGLSATMKPLEVASRLLVGAQGTPPRIVDVGLRRDFDLAIEVPRDELGAVCTNEQWQELYERVANLARAHASTIVFVNTRRLCERLALHLGERLGDDQVAAHHGSLSRARRLDAEQRLKAGALKVVVATSSLELGIDVGAVELACVVGSPRSVAIALQRIGRSGHMLGATPKGRFFPVTRDELVECAALVRAARAGVIDAIALRDAPLDVLAQQITAIAASEDRAEDDVFEVVRRAAPYGELSRATFEAVVTMVSEGIANRRGRAGALVHRDAVNGRLRGRRGARLAALTSGGAIPDNNNYDVLEFPDGTKVGTVDEDFAIDSRPGMIFALGHTSWRMRRLETGKMWVENAHGAASTVPFWFGEAPARTAELSDAVGALREEVARRVAEGEAPEITIAWAMQACALDEAGARLLRDYLAAGLAVLGALPSTTTVVAERFFDEGGGQQLVLHAPFGGRINRAWGSALRKRFCRTFDFELQAAATDDGVLLSLGPQHSFPLEGILELLRPDGLREVLEQAALQAPMFGTRFRWNATRSLALLRFQGGRKVPPPLQRMRSEDLLAAVFPGQVGCQDNHGGGPIEMPDHPLVSETMRDCLTELMDVEGLAKVLAALGTGAIRFVARETTEPSVLSHEILNANPYAFLDDAPLEERRARAVSLRRGLPAEIVDRLGGLDQEAIASVVRDATPSPRDADELHDLLLDQGAYADADPVLARELIDARRAAWLVTPSALDGGDPHTPAAGARLLVAAERRSLASVIWPSGVFEPELAEPGGAKEIAREDALANVVRGRLSIVGPRTAAELDRELSLEPGDADIALVRLELDGGVLRGRFRSGAGDLEWCDRRLLARIHRLTVDGLRRAIEPVTASDLVRFLLRWQGVTGARHRGRGGLLRAIDQLQGFELAAGAWESDVLPARVPDYEPAWLDELCLSGELVWGRLAPREAGGAPTRTALITLARRRDFASLFVRTAAPADDALSESARAVLAYLSARGASFLDEIATDTSRGRAEIEDALWELCAAGRVTGDGFAGLRSLLRTRTARAATDGAWRAGRLRGGAAPIASGRWSLLRGAAPTSDLDPIETAAHQYLRRYGVVMRDLLERESNAPPWRDLVRVYRRMEMRGEIRGGRMVASFVGEQFALPEALDALRAIRKEPRAGTPVRLSACDPLNLVGTIVPGPRASAHLGGWVEYVDGVPARTPEAGEVVALQGSA